MSYTTVHYMNRNMAIHMDIPIDNPYGGPAFGQKLKGGNGLGKVIGVVAAVAAVATGWGMAVTAGWSGAGALAGGAMMAGGVMSGIGAVTGNKKLSQIGGILSLAGGAYGMAFDKAGSFVLGKEGATSLASEGTAAALNKFNETFGTSLGKTAEVVKATDTTINVGTDQGSLLAAQDAAVTGNTGIDAGTAAAAKTAGVTTPQGGLISGSAQSQILAGQDAGVTGVPGLAKGTTAAIGGVQTPATSGGLINDILNGKNSGQLVGSAIQGLATAASGNAQAEQMAGQTSLLAQKYANDQANLKLQLKNLNSPGGVHYNPNDPNAQKIVAAGQAAGITMIPLSINQNANVQSPMAAFQGAKV